MLKINVAELLALGGAVFVGVVGLYVQFRIHGLKIRILERQVRELQDEVKAVEEKAKSDHEALRGRLDLIVDKISKIGNILSNIEGRLGK